MKGDEIRRRKRRKAANRDGGVQGTDVAPRRQRRCAPYARGAIESSDDARLALRVGEAATRLAISRSRLYELVAAQQVPHVRIGSSIRFPVAALERWLEAHTVGASEN